MAYFKFWWVIVNHFVSYLEYQLDLAFAFSMFHWLLTILFRVKDTTNYIHTGIYRILNISGLFMTRFTCQISVCEKLCSCQFREYSWCTDKCENLARRDVWWYKRRYWSWNQGRRFVNFPSWTFPWELSSNRTHCNFLTSCLHVAQ